MEVDRRMIKPKSSIFILTIIIFCIFGFISKVQAGWLPGYSYRKSVTLSRLSGAVTNYQMKLKVGESSGASGYDVHCNGHVLSNFNDLRFTKSDGATLLNYWIESISGTTPNQTATIWIKFDSIGTSATKFYMYYGNAGASSYSNGDNTFLFFDHFEGTSLDSNKWDSLIGTGGSITVSSSIVKLRISIGGTDQWQQTSISQKTPYTFNRPFAVRIKTKEYDPNETWSEFCPIGIRKDSSNLFGYERQANTNRHWRKRIGGTSTYVLSESWSNDGNWHIHDFAFRSADWSAWLDDTQKVNANAENTVLTGLFCLLRAEAYYASSATEHWFDFVIVRNYVSSGAEPAWGTWGAEEIGGKITHGSGGSLTLGSGGSITE